MTFAIMVAFVTYATIPDVQQAEVTPTTKETLAILRREVPLRPGERAKRLTAAFEKLTCSQLSEVVGNIGDEADAQIVAALIDRAVDVGSVEIGTLVASRMSWQSGAVVLRACARAAAAVQLRELDELMSHLLQDCKDHREGFALASYWAYHAQSIMANDELRRFYSKSTEAERATIIEIAAMCRTRENEKWLRREYVNTKNAGLQACIVKSLGRMNRQAHREFLHHLIGSEVTAEVFWQATDEPKLAALQELIYLADPAAGRLNRADRTKKADLSRLYALQWWGCSRLMHTLDVIRVDPQQRQVRRSGTEQILEFLGSMLMGIMDVKLLSERKVLPVSYGEWRFDDPVQGTMLTLLERNVPMFSDISPTERDLVVWGVVEPDWCLVLGTRADFLKYAEALDVQIAEGK